MANEAREMLSKLLAGAEALGRVDKERMQAFNTFVETTEKAGALDLKIKELIVVAISLYSRCDGCIVHHTQEALKSGASREELI